MHSGTWTPRLIHAVSRPGVHFTASTYHCSRIVFLVVALATAGNNEQDRVREEPRTSFVDSGKAGDACLSPDCWSSPVKPPYLIVVKLPDTRVTSLWLSNNQLAPSRCRQLWRGQRRWGGMSLMLVLSTFKPISSLNVKWRIISYWTIFCKLTISGFSSCPSCRTFFLKYLNDFDSLTYEGSNNNTLAKLKLLLF